MSRKLIMMLMMVVAMMFATSGMAVAEETSGQNYDDSKPHMAFSTANNHDALNRINHTHDYEDNFEADTNTHRDEYKPKFEMGLGVDLVVYENADQGYIPDEVTVESRYDVSNNNGSVYIVAKYNIWERFFSGNVE